LLPWHASRGPLRELVAALDLVASACGKIALDVVLLAQTEVGEVRVPPGGVSSTMPHKRNPVAAVLAQACARRVRALVGTFTWEHEHERAAGAWHAEWEPLSDTLALTGGAAAHVRETLEGLEVDAAQMRANLRPEAVSEACREIAPEAYLGSAEAFVDRALAAYRAES
jgi:3-carboxy-cis,cis-muconate cycloisomerase